MTLDALSCSPIDTRHSLTAPALDDAGRSISSVQSAAETLWMHLQSGECIKVLVRREDGEWRAYEGDWQTGFPVGRGESQHAAYLNLKSVLETRA